MDKIPFSIYDVFGYLAAGFLVILAADFAFRGGWLIREEVGMTLGLFWTVAAYVTGHLVAQVSSALLENRVVRRAFGPPEETLFRDDRPAGWKRLFRGFYEPLPRATRERILTKAKQAAGISEPGRALFLHCHPIVKRDETTLGRLNTFLNLYGFSRNMCLALVMAAILLGVGVCLDWRGGGAVESGRLWGIAVALGSGGGMFYRYLKFFRHYTVEVFITYAELDLLARKSS